eukprot:scaffold204_cov135-Skeletonema_menzelii.AAC.8
MPHSTSTKLVVEMRDDDSQNSDCSSESAPQGISRRVLRSRSTSHRSRQPNHEDKEDGEEDNGGASSSDDEDGKDDSYSDGEANSTYEGSQDEEEAKEEEDNDNIPLKDLTVVQLREKCKKHNLKSSGNKGELIQRIQRSQGNSGNDNNDSPDAIDYKYEYDQNGVRLWPSLNNPHTEVKEYIRRMQLIDDNDLGDAPRKAWAAALPDEGKNLYRWYKRLHNRTIVRTEKEFHLDVINFCGLTVRQIGARVQEYNEYCLRVYGRTFPLPPADPVTPTHSRNAKVSIVQPLEEHGAWAEVNYEPLESEFIEKLKAIEGVSQVETQEITFEAL